MSGPKEKEKDEAYKIAEDDKEETRQEIVQEEAEMDLMSSISSNLKRDEQFRLEKLP